MEQLSFKVESFSGPLDLLLHLIQKNKISIYDIPILEITTQYMEYLNKMEELDLEVTGDFLVMAAKLMLIKSKMLLPKSDEEDPREELVNEILEYQKYKNTISFFEEHSKSGLFTYVKEPDEIIKTFKNYDAIESTIDLLTDAFSNVIKKVERRSPPSKSNFNAIRVGKVYSIEEKEIFISDKLEEHKTIEFSEFFEMVESRGEAVAVFLAILNLIRSGNIRAKNKKNKICLYINKNGDNNGNKED